MANSFHGLMHKIGRYQVEQELGRGAMGIVYRAFDPAIGRRIAIKTIRLDQFGDAQSHAQLRERLLREAQSAGILSHPNIVTIYDISEDETNAYIFMEYVEGATLEQYSRGLPVSELLALLEQAAAALDYAHQRGIVHRDIKPGNLMLSGRQLKITDFGIARLNHRDSTQSGALLGTPSYMSPEQIAGNVVTGAADQYALAVIAYEYLSGSRPFDNDNLANLLFRITQQPVPPVLTLNAATNQVLARALAKKPENRYACCVDFVSALKQALGIVAPHYTPQRIESGDAPTLIAKELQPPQAAVDLPPRAKPVAAPERRSRPGILAGLLGGAGLVIGVLWFAMWPRTAAPPATPAVVESAPAETKPSPIGEAASSAAAEVAAPAPPEASPTADGQVLGKKTAASEQGSATMGEPTAHSVVFLTNPERAEILVNEGTQDRCPATPCTLELPAGEYRIRAKLTGFPDMERRLRVPAESRWVANFEKAEGTIAVNSTPSGAMIRVDGKDTGLSTPAMLKLAPGQYTLEVVKNGLSPQSQTVVIRQGVVQTLAIQWN
ncbi:MAG: serine/threonine-protein kinase [Acidobacteriota bacterium]